LVNLTDTDFYGTEIEGRSHLAEMKKMWAQSGVA